MELVVARGFLDIYKKFAYIVLYLLSKSSDESQQIAFLYIY